MSDAPLSQRLLTAVTRRLRWQALGHAACWSILTVTIAFAIGLVVRRLTGLLPDVFSWESFAAIPFVAAALALAFFRRPAVSEAARAVDRTAGAQDLYLTLAQLEHSMGAYQPLVVQSAEATAGRIQPQRVAPYQWPRRTRTVIWLLAIVALAQWQLPQLDPFGKVASASLVAQRKDRLVESRKETQLRLADLKAKVDESPEETPTTEAIDGLKLALNKMQPQQKQANLESLMDEQKELGTVWKQLNQDALKNLLKHKADSDQQFGAADQELLKKLGQELQEGSMDGLKQEMESLKDQLQKLAKTTDPVEKEKLKQEIKKRMETLDNFAKKNIDSKALQAAMQRAMKQMDLAQLDDLSSEALDAAMESLDLAEMELEELAQSADDLKKLEEALKAMKLAKRLNEHDKLDGKDSQGCKTMADYEALYKKLLAKCEGECQGEGQCPGCGQCQGSKRGNGKTGMRGPGTGEGGVAPEDDSIKTEFQSEVAKSAVTAGKILFSQKQKGLGEKGAAQGEYRSLAQQVKQGVADALEQEQVPPGYHRSIQKYFDALDAADAPKP